jgi:tetratricopeptide (TPR) repeat protein
MSNVNHSRILGLTLIAIPILFVSLVVLQRDIDAAAAPLENQQPELIIRSGKMLKKMSLGYDSLLADIYWTRAVQYFGYRVGKPGETFPLLDPLLDITTTLDPHLIVAYRFGTIFLSEPDPAGAGEPNVAVELVKKGIAANPDEWRLYQDLGFLYSIRLKDYPKAAEAYLEGSKNPKAHIFMKVLAASVAGKGNDLETSRLIWGEVYNTTQDELVRNRALQHLKAIQANLDLQHLNEASEAYATKLGHFPATIGDLQEAGFVHGDPKDPEGYPYVIGQHGVPQLDPQSPVVLDPDKRPGAKP